MTDRPKTLREIAERAESLPHFGREFADWLHTLRTLSTRRKISAAIEQPPAYLHERFHEGEIADAWLAAYAEHIADHLALPRPEWVNQPKRISSKPWYASDSPTIRARAQKESPPAFKNRNLFTDHVDLPLRLRAGRPPKSDEEKRQTNAARQRRFRARRALEQDLLRASLAHL